LIFWTIFESYNIFTAKTEPPQIFKMTSKENNQEILKLPSKFQKQIEILQKQIIAEQFSKILPADSIVKLLNLFSWSIGAFILFSGGMRLSQIGINLLKN